MQKSLLSLACCLIFGATAWSQTPTYADSIANILYQNCSNCHHTGGIAPFPLMSYSDAYTYRNQIASETASGDMPPWPPNPDYKELVHERILTQDQINGIAAWVAGGAPQGNPANEPTPPTFNNTSILGAGDLQVQAPHYISKATFGNDDYVCFSVPLGLTQDTVLKAIEVIPGNAEIVHHVLVYIDPSGTYPTDTVGGNCAGPSGFGSEKLVMGYAPGGSPIVFPNDGANLRMGINIPAGSNIILAMHYPAGSQGMLDSTKVNLHFYGNSGNKSAAPIREVEANPILAQQNFCINANTVQDLEAWFPSATLPVPNDFSLLSVFPHAHLLGKEFIVYAVNHLAPHDTIPIIHIPEWDFEWQDFYFFKKILKMPAGYKLYAKATYDNTTNNPFNPHNPPQTVCEGLNTTDEMFLVYFQYLPYQQGDEFINLDSLLNSNTSSPITGTRKPVATLEDGLFLTAYPNPTNGQTTFEYYMDKPNEVSLTIYDIQGRIVHQLFDGQQDKGRYQLQWQGDDASGQALANGVYIAKLRVGNRLTTHKVVLSR